MPAHPSILRSTLLLSLALVPLAPARAAEEVPNFNLLDLSGKNHEVRRIKTDLVALFFTGTGCPVVRKSAPKLLELKQRLGDKLTVWLIDAELDADRAAVRQEGEELGLSAFPVLLDTQQTLARVLGVQRTAEMVILETKTWSVVYRGALDDQLAEGEEKPAPTVKYAEEAMVAHLAGKPVTTARTTARGCLITFGEAAKSEVPVDYVKEVAPLLQQHCVGCHRAGDIGPFAFSGHATAKRKARMIEEVLLTQRMPPWHADPHFGKFDNGGQLTGAETHMLLRWIRQGAPRGEGEDPLAVVPPAPEDWPLGQPDYIIKLPKPEEIPATGVLEYRHIKIDSPVQEDVWLGASMVRPGNRKVLHHAIVYAKFEGSGFELGAPGIKIGGWAPGRVPGRLPEGTGVFLGKNAKIDIELHYTTNGTPQTDDTEIGLYVLKEKPPLAYKTGMAIKLAFSIPPYEPEAKTSAKFRFAKDSILYTLTPHMHVRGSWMKFDAIFPDGKTETLLSVPRYDFNWQTTYRLAEPRRMPAGTVILCSGAFDNSTLNLSNPDPSKTVRWGSQSWDEMFIGYVGYAEVPTEKKDAPASLSTPAAPSAASTNPSIQPALSIR